VFTVFDKVDELKGTKIRPCLYFFETDNYMPIRCNCWYYHNMVCYKTIENLLKKFIMEQSSVKHVKAAKKDIKEGCSTISILGNLGVEYCEHKYEYYSQFS
jgi:hypothetical protein